MPEVCKNDYIYFFFPEVDFCAKTFIPGKVMANPPRPAHRKPCAYHMNAQNWVSWFLWTSRMDQDGRTVCHANPQTLNRPIQVPPSQLWCDLYSEQCTMNRKAFEQLWDLGWNMLLTLSWRPQIVALRTSLASSMSHCNTVIMEKREQLVAGFSTQIAQVTSSTHLRPNLPLVRKYL